MKELIKELEEVLELGLKFLYKYEEFNESYYNCDNKKELRENEHFKRVGAKFDLVLDCIEEMGVGPDFDVYREKLRKILKEES